MQDMARASIELYICIIKSSRATAFSDELSTQRICAGQQSAIIVQARRHYLCECSYALDTIEAAPA
jgi:hypothetical protein